MPRPVHRPCHHASSKVDLAEQVQRFIPGGSGLGFHAIPDGLSPEHYPRWAIPGALSPARLALRYPRWTIPAELSPAASGFTLSRAMLSRVHAIPAHYPRRAPEKLSRVHAIPAHAIPGALSPAASGSNPGPCYPGDTLSRHTIPGELPKSYPRFTIPAAHAIPGANAIPGAWPTRPYPRRSLPGINPGINGWCSPA